MLSYIGARKFGWVAIICGLSFFAEFTGLFSQWNQRLGDARMSASQVASDGQIVFVAVDSASLDGIGTWPWSRDIHAALLDVITKAGAVDVLFDFDFAFPSDLAGDQAFARALERAGGATYLAVFEQQAIASDPASRHFNLPLPAFHSQSWAALVNVKADRQGLVRRYPFGAHFGNEFVPSAGALIANELRPATQSFEIDFSIRADSVPTVSAIDVLQGRIPANFLAGQSVIIGASAIELADQLAVPVQGILSGPLVHALAAETLTRGREIVWLRSQWIGLGLFLALLGLVSGMRGKPLMCLGGATVFLVGIELAALWAFRVHSILVPSAMFFPGLLGFVFVSLLESLKANQWLLLKTSIDARNTLRLLERVFDDGSDGIVIVNEEGHVLRHSTSAADIFGTDDNGKLILPKQLQRAKPLPALAPQRLIEIDQAGASKILEYHVTSSNIEQPMGLSKAPKREQIVTLVVRDVTQLKESERNIAYLSNYDDRTGALRRHAFLAFLGLRLDHGNDTIIFALSIDRLKTVNVTLGRAIGDAILKDVVTRLERSELQLSAPMRLGGTSFAFFTEGASDVSSVYQKAQDLLADIGRDYRLKDSNAQIGVRIGFTTVQGDTEVTAETALEQAVEALDASKVAGHSIAAYDHKAWEKQRRAREIERALEAALENNEFQLLYQPQHRVSDSALIGAEALIRWHSPTLGTVFPDEFIDIAESTGFIVKLGKWTLEQAARDALILPPEISIAVNVSGIQLMKSDLAADVIDALKTVGLNPNRICLELTETVMLESSDQIIETMQDLSFQGVTWALDDFGTGFSSMEYLSRMPLDKVKLDKSFTMQLGEDPKARAILHSTCELCRGLGVKLLCEGVETADQLAILAEEGCVEGQGYFYGKPRSIDELLSNAAQHTQKTKAEPRPFME